MEPPIKPNESDCCNSGCSPCILDVYEDQLKKYKASIIQKPTTNCLSSTSFSVFKLIDVRTHSRDCSLYTFEYLRPLRHSSGSSESDKSVVHEPGQYLLLKAKSYGETFQKAYTPIYVENQAPNCFTVLVKFYENGRMSWVFQRLAIGSETSWRGPYGDYRIDYNYKRILFIAQGTGIAPFYSILCDMLNNEECYTFLTLFFCCNAENLLLRDELYKLGEFWNFKYELFISGDSKNGFKKKYNEIVHFKRLGFDHIKEFLNTTNDVKVLVCGADNFCKNIRNMLVQCNIPDEDITIF